VALLGAVLGLWGIALLWPWRRGGKAERRKGGEAEGTQDSGLRTPRVVTPWLTAVVLTCVAGALAFVLFYRIPLTGTHAVTADASLSTPSVTQNGGRYEIGGPRPDPTIGLPDHRTDNPVIAVAGQLGEEGYAFYRVWPLVLAPLGWWLLISPNPLSPFPRGRGDSCAALVTSYKRTFVSPFPRSAGEGQGEGAISLRLVALCVVWCGVSLLFLIVGVLTGRYVRYSMTAIPAVTIGAGMALGYLWRWRWGRAVALLLLAFSVASTLLVWYGRITRAYHFCASNER
jgi:hypothetical protein